MYRYSPFSVFWHRTFPQYLGVFVVVLLATLVLFNLQLGDANISLLYLLMVLFCATISNAKVTIFCGVVSFLCYDFFLVSPAYNFFTGTPIKLLDPLAFLTVAFVTAMLSERSRQYAIEKAVYQEASQFRATILQLVSHNLRTPLAAIKTSLTTLVNAYPLQPIARELLVTADQECDRLNRLIENVLQLSRLDAHAVQLHKDWNALEEVISSVFSRWHDAVFNKQLTASIPVCMPLIEFDFALIESALTNLVENAFRHGTPPVHVAIQLQSSEVLISVEDCGSGVVLEDRAKLFNQFSTASSSGLGLGLAVCKGLVSAHGGRLWADFKTGKTKFIIGLPLVTYEANDHEPFAGC